MDAIICSTSWKWYAQICLAAQNTDKHAVCEVPIVFTINEAWRLVEAYESTSKWATLALDGFGDLNVMNLVQQGVLGDIIHAEAG